MKSKEELASEAIESIQEHLVHDLSEFEKHLAEEAFEKGFGIGYDTGRLHGDMENEIDGKNEAIGFGIWIEKKGLQWLCTYGPMAPISTLRGTRTTWQDLYQQYKQQKDETGA